MVVAAYNLNDTSLHNARVVVAVEYLFESARARMNLLALRIIMLISAIPCGLLFWILRRKFNKRMRKDVPELKTVGAYQTYRKRLHEMEVLMPSLKKVTNYKLANAPWGARYALRQMQKMSSTLISYTEWSRSRLVNLNKPQFDNQGTSFKFKSEEELWEQKNPVYEYWM